MYFFIGAIYRHVDGKLLSSSKSGKLLLVLKNKLGDLNQSETAEYFLKNE